MGQTYSIPVSRNESPDTIFGNVEDALDSIVSCFSGATAPSSPVAGMLWFQTTLGVCWQRNAANNAWRPVSVTHNRIATDVALSGGEVFYAAPPFSGGYLLQAALTSDTATGSSSAGVNDWEFQIVNVTDSVNTMSATWKTSDAEILSTAVYLIAPDQNQAFANTDKVSFNVTKTGSPTSLAGASITIDLMWANTIL